MLTLLSTPEQTPLLSSVIKLAMTVKHLILGGARSGKSRFAERTTKQLASHQNKQLIYIATATADDQEMAERIKKHQQDRTQDWQLKEHPTKLAAAIEKSTDQQSILVDCLTLWLSNCLHQNIWQEEKDAFLNALKQCPCDVVLVSNEVGSGIIPMGELSRQFVDESGWLHQQLADICTDVSMVVAGLAMPLKSSE